MCSSPPRCAERRRRRYRIHLVGILASAAGLRSSVVVEGTAAVLARSAPRRSENTFST
jgi:hypothetical protein